MDSHKVQNEASEERVSDVLKKLLFFTILMVTVPISSYFLSKSYVFEDYLKMNSTSSYFYAAIVAVVAVHAVLGLFVYVAWNEGKKSTYKTD